ncbi:MAG: cysteine desulfurase [Candidatus Berkelbacteria bacterium]|nr:cysteine desulfurase [Candidatus Berkelbacteria bacterium]MCR4307766.1 cysteine desulfurase [Candidatus Berkelbacteria bacterium]
MKSIYADYAASTPTDPRVVEVMEPYMTDFFGNPSSIHSFGREADVAVGEATEIISRFLGCKKEEVFYTSCGTESNNLAVIGVAKANKDKGRHIITTAIEHPSIMNACKALEKDGWEVTYLPVTKEGLVEVESLEKVLKKETVLVSIHLANSEVGVIQNIAKLARISNKHGALFHTDACQAAAYLNLNVKTLGVDLLTLNGSKMYGPKGIAVLYVREGVNIFPIFYGGSQQKSLRSGTENVPGIVGLAKACEIASDNQEKESQRIGQLRNQLEKELSKIPGLSVNCAGAVRLPNHLSVTFNESKESNLVEVLDNKGIAVSSGSACSSKSIVDSHVLQRIGLSGDQIHKTIRFSLGRQTTSEQVKKIAQVARVI